MMAELMCAARQVREQHSQHHLAACITEAAGDNLTAQQAPRFVDPILTVASLLPCLAEPQASGLATPPRRAARAAMCQVSAGSCVAAR